MFELQGKPNLLADLLGQSAGHFMEHQQKTKTQKSLLDTLSKINEDTSPLEAFKVIEASGLPPEEKKRLHEGGFKVQEMRGKQQRESAEKYEKTKQEEAQKLALAKQYNLDPEQIKDLTAAQVGSIGKNLNPIGSRPIPEEQLSKIQKVRSTPGFENMDDVQQYQAFTDAGVAPNLAKEEARIKGEQLGRRQKEVANSLETQKDFISKTTGAAKAWETETKPRLKQMQQLNQKDLVGPAGAALFESLGLPLALLDNPANEVYEKLSQDLLKGLPETYGSRILKVEVDNFLKTIPRLINSPEGRRMIASNILKLGEMKEVFYKSMRDQQKAFLDNGKPLPADFEQRIFDQVSPQIDRINNEFLQLSQIEKVPEGTIPYFSPFGGIEFVPNTPDDIQWANENGGKKIW